MKLSHLKQITNYLQNVKKISAIYRVDDSTLKIAFDKDNVLFFSLQPSNSKIFKSDTLQRIKVYQAPFDVMLFKTFNRADIISVSLLNDDKILRIECSQNSAYKSQIYTLQLEFTGKHTNAIILDNQKTVLEALRHIGDETSFRVVMVGETLEDIPKAPFQAKEYPIEDVEAYLYDVYEDEKSKKLNSFKKQKTGYLQKRLTKLQKLYSNLADSTTLEQEAEELQMKGNIILSNIHLLKPYMKEIELYDYEGNPITITFDKQLSSISQMSQYFFKVAKKTKQRALYTHIEKESLEEKISYYEHFIQTINEANDISEIKLLFPEKQQKKRKKEKVIEGIETFYIDNYKIMLGKSEKGNIALLKNARAKDVWVHLKDRPSAHVIIVTDKQNVPLHIIEYAAKLCVNFSVSQRGDYLVDYTPRREVTIQNGANVLYNKYKTVSITK